MVECRNCGLCCHSIRKGKVHRCRYLIGDVGNTRCRIYYRRLGHSTGKGHVCGLRRNKDVDFEGCPYNSGKPLSPLVIRKGKVINIEKV